ncbi:MAG TPA: hypothetical protein VLG25_03385 [Patescibacteria group bacterium]|nr:hypothetical protein [Patescibacteria group bacterium]
MSSATTTLKRVNLFKTYLVSQNEGEETEKTEEKPAEPTSALTYKTYAPTRASFNTFQGRIKRYFS